MSATLASRPLALPAIDRAALVTLMIAGAFATLAFDFFGQTISPLLKGIVPTLGSKLAPAPLANASLAAIFGVEGRAISGLGLGHGLHLIAGLIAYPVGWAFIAKPISERVAPALPWFVSAAVYGVVLWAFALYVMAHLVAGMPAFLGFSGITWVALWGHIVFALVAAAVWRARTI